MHLGWKEHWEEAAQAHKAKIQKPEQAGYVVRLAPGAEEDTTISWYVLHHMVQHNSNNRIAPSSSEEITSTPPALPQWVELVD